jgi:hypothetical protein
MLLLFDENAPRSLASFFQQQRHDILSVGVDLAKTVSDNEVILFARAHEAVIVTWNHKHFGPRAHRELQPTRTHLRTWGLLTYHLPEPDALKRTADLLETILFEYEQCAMRRPACLILRMEIWPAFFRVYR